jgi:hypothetical protein
MQLESSIDPAEGSEKHPSQSYLRLTYPFSSSRNLKKLYSKGAAIDVAHWLEDMDTFAGNQNGHLLMSDSICLVLRISRNFAIHLPLAWDPTAS